MSQQPAESSLPLTPARALARVNALFAPDPQERVGLELETFVADAAGQRPTLDRLPECEQLPRGSRLTWEPGGQMEISSPPRSRLDRARCDLTADLAHAERLLEVRGLHVLPGAFDHRPPRRLLEHPRYAAMEASFDAVGPAGRQMMTNTASVQVNVSAGPDPVQRFRLLLRLAPVLAAVFADAPGTADDGLWMSLRQRAWLQLDPRRVCLEIGSSPIEDYTRFALEADVFVVRRGDTWHRVPRGFSMSAWMTSGHPDLGRPTLADLDYHLTTLFPPVRPRGWFEVRVLDRLDRLHCDLAAALTLAATLPEVGDALDGALPTAAPSWHRAARLGLGDPVLAVAADQVLGVLVPALPHVTADPLLMEAGAVLHATRVTAARSSARATRRHHGVSASGSGSLEPLQEPLEERRQLAAL